MPPLPLCPLPSSREIPGNSEKIHLTATLHADTLEHMFGNDTAFKHFKCGGLVFRRKYPHAIIFKCAKCWQWSEDILDLILEPHLRCSGPEEEMLQETAESYSKT